MARSIQNLFITLGLAAVWSACGNRVEMGELEQRAGMSTPIALAPTLEGMCALDDAGRVACWTDGHPESARVVPGVGQPVRLSGSDYFFCAIQGDGTLGCRDLKAAGPFQPVPEAGSVQEVSVGDGGGCALTEAGTVLSWMLEGPDGSFGLDSPELMRLPRRALQVSDGASHICAVLDDGRVFCHGSNAYGISDGSVGTALTSSYTIAPTALPGIDDARHVTATYNSTCVLHQSGKVTCIGAVEEAGLGPLSTAEGRGELAELEGATALGSSVQGNCALSASGGLLCWGHDTCGLYSDRTGPCETETVLTPTALPGFESVKSFAIGSGSVCAIDRDDRVWCRGARHDHYTGGSSGGAYRVPL